MEKAVKKATARILLDERRKNKDDLHPVRLRVIFDRKYKDWGLEMHFSKAEYEKIINGRALSVDLAKIKKKIAQKLSDANKIIDDLGEDFTYNEFYTRMFNKQSKPIDLFSALQIKVDTMNVEGRISTARSFECALNSFKEFTGRKELKFDEITVSLLKRYETYLTTKQGKGKKKGQQIGEGKVRSLTTVGFYTRMIRIVCREAIRSGLMKKYPFGSMKEGLYEIPTGANVKKALSREEIVRIFNYQTIPGSIEDTYLKYWQLSFLCNGLNIKDLVKLKYSNIDNERMIIQLVRQKTKSSTRSKPVTIKIAITRPIGAILDAVQVPKDKDHDSFILPILKPGMTAVQEYDTIQQTIKLINKYINKVAQACFIEKKVTTYTARHSFATLLRNGGASTEYISKALGHTNLITTEKYLADFPLDVVNQMAEIITNSIK